MFESAVRVCNLTDCPKRMSGSHTDTGVWPIVAACRGRKCTASTGSSSELNEEADAVAVAAGPVAADVEAKAPALAEAVVEGVWIGAPAPFAVGKESGEEVSDAADETGSESGCEGDESDCRARFLSSDGRGGIVGGGGMRGTSCSSERGGVEREYGAAKLVMGDGVDGGLEGYA